jgi:hypothetical protein
MTPLPSLTSPAASDTATPLPTRTSFVPVDTITPSPSTEAVALAPTSTALPVTAQLPQRTQYALAVHLDYERHHLAVSQTITYVNQSGEPLPDLLLVVEPNRQPGVFHLNNLNWAGGLAVEGYTLEGARLGVPLPQSLSPGANIGLSLSFELDLPARPAPLGYTLRQTNLGDWYPFAPPRSTDQGWLLHEPSVVGEHLVYDAADYRVDINLGHPATDLTIAASAPGQSDGNRHSYRLEAARGFAWSVGPEYQVFSQQVASATVVSYVFPEHLAAGQAALRATADALTLYAELFGPYPHTSLTLVEADLADGMEYDGLYFLGQEYYAAYAGGPQGYLTAIAVHETAHQWWYGLVGNDQALEPWLDESLCTYSELLFYAAFYPALTDWWWEFRVTRFNPAGWVNSAIYDHAGFRPYVDAVYLRGAQFMDELRNSMGQEAFLAFLHDYAARGAHDRVTAEDFFTLLAEHSSVDTNVLVQAYFAPAE